MWWVHEPRLSDAWNPGFANQCAQQIGIMGVAFTQEEHMRKGQKVETLTKTVGQTPRIGVVIDLREEDLVEVEWEDGHTSIVTRSVLMPTTGSKRSESQSG